MNDLERIADRLDTLLDRVEGLLPPRPTGIDWQRSHAARWIHGASGGGLEPVPHTHPIRLDALQHIERQRDAADLNTRQFLAGLPANNVLLSGARGTGKSSLIKALLNEYATEGLRLIEVEPQYLVELPRIIAAVAQRPERFILFCDDLSFEADDPSYKALKAALDGSIAAPPENLLIYATSNRRHLLPEYFSENEQARMVDGEIHPGEAVEEKISLSERFGLWLSFQPFDQQRYLDICAAWIDELQAPPAPPMSDWRADALRFALERGSRSGRVAWQFARHWVGSRGLV
ncbi:ATP-binding protein [Spiribacter onubensis]|uniref:ATP-binding protein n=1 Tax=Spiribacter onubensis TaxID=3122420 RepID=A0ABV3SAA8_9GAMM